MTEIQEDRIDSPTTKVLVNERTLELYGWTAAKLAAPVVENDYGMQWPKGTLQYFKEARLYRLTKGLRKLFHLVNMIKLDLPFFQFTSIGYINTNALRVLKACVDHRRLGIAGAASTGKTFPVGAYVLEDWKSAPDITLSFVCTTDMGAAENRIWGTIVKMWQNSSIKIGTYIPHKHVITWGNLSDSASDRDYSAAIKALAIPKGEEGKKAIDITRGRKQNNVRLVFDELPEMETYVTEASVNLASNSPNPLIDALGLQVVGIGNPMRHDDAHGQFCRPAHPLGYKSINRNTPEWKTRTGWCIFLNGEWSPNLEAPLDSPIPFPRLTNRDSLADMLADCHGERESIQYYRNAIGFWPETSALQSVLTPELITSRGSLEKPTWGRVQKKRVAGFDTSFSVGGDKCVLHVGEVGMTIVGRSILNHVAEEVIVVPASGVFEDQLAQAVVDKCIFYGVEPDGFGMDISSDGGKIMQAIIRYWMRRDIRATEIFAISSMGRPTDRQVSNVDPRKCSEAYDRRVTEYWMMVREAVLCEVIRSFPLYKKSSTGLEELTDTARQLCARTYEIRGKKFVLETKGDMKSRLGGESPDNADSFVYMVEMGRRHGLVFRTPDDLKREDARRGERRASLVNERQGDYGSNDWGEDAA